jgi:two-component system, LytTR family, sensor kinase
MSDQPRSPLPPLWRRGRFWLWAWLGLTLGGAALLAWDARAWLAGAPQASFRYTWLNTWPLEGIWWLLAPGIVWLQRRLVWIDGRWPWAALRHLLMLAAILGLFHLLAAARAVLGNHLPWSFLPEMLADLRRTEGWDYLPALAYLLLIAAVYAVSFYQRWQEGRRLTGELQLANAQLETRLVRASLAALKMQLHPHFLFNTLNSITSLIRNQRTREAEDIVAGLGELLRRALDHRQEAMDTLERELDFLRRYFEIERIRFQDRLQVEFDIDPKCLRALVPGLLLQPLAENAMKHGISRAPAACLLRVSAARDGSRLLLTVYNDGPPLPRDEAALGRGIGLANSRARLQMLYGDEARLRLRDQPPHGVRAEILLPFRTAATPP